MDNFRADLIGLLSPLGIEPATAPDSLADTATSEDTASSSINTTTPADEIIPPADTTAPTDAAPSLADTTTPTDNNPSADTTTASIENTTIPTTPSPSQPNVQQNIPVVQSPPVITKVTSPILFGNFKTGVVPIMILFDKPVFVSGNPQLILSTGSPAATVVDYKSSSRNLLLFLYRISPGNYSSDLSYSSSSALVLNGGEIKDGSGNPANLTLPEPGSPDSLSGYSNIVINAPQ